MSPTYLMWKVAWPIKLIGFSLGLLFVISAWAESAHAQTRPPVLISEPTSTRAIALESPTFFREPFAITSPFAWSTDQRTRVMLFALNLSLQPGEDLSVMAAEAEDATRRHYSLPVEYVGPAPGQSWLTAVIVRLNDEMTGSGDVLVRVSYRGVGSNRVRLGIGQIGGGPPDDFDATPTPAPPYFISGQVTSGGVGLSDVTVTLSGLPSQTVTTDANGFYTLMATTAANYTVNVSKLYYNLAPSSRTFTNLSYHQANINFVATRQTYTISGQVRDDAGQPLGGIVVGLVNEIGGVINSVFSDAGGNYTFPNVAAGYSYTVVAQSTNFYSFTAQNVGVVSGNLTLDLRATRPTYVISGRLTDAAGQGIGGMAVNLSGAQTATATTNNDGYYSIPGVVAAGNYTIVPAPNPYYNFTPQSVNNLGGNQTLNFTGALRVYTISGHLDNGQSAALGGVTMNLSGTESGSVQTDVSGNYSFTVHARGNYLLTPSKANYDFNPDHRSYTNLGSNQAAAFTGTLRHYVVNGHVTDSDGESLAGIAMNLSGSETSSTQTDSNGNYSFSLLAEGDYSITPAKLHYDFAPLNRTFQNLSSPQEASFQGILRHYLISGRVTDTNGQGINGIAIALSGPQPRTVRTASDGSYSFSAAAGNDYTVAPSIEQDYYLIAPSNRSLLNLITDQTGNDFIATLAPIPVPTYVLEYDGTPKSVDYGNFWEPYVDLGHFYWEFWAMPGNNAGATYMLSDGYGGAHALLFGFIGSGVGGHYQLYGNIFDGFLAGQHIISFGSDEGPAPGEWGHYAVGWDGQHIITYFNGVPVGKLVFTGPRATPGPGGGGGKLLIGGSDHSNFVGRIAQVRGYEGRNPLEEASGPTGGMVESTFAPQTVFGVGGNLLSYFFRQSPKVADLSRGFNGITQTGATHVGTPRGTTAGVPFDCGNCPPPQFVLDPTAPNFAQNIAPPPLQIDPPPPVPNGARVFDSFSRANSTYIFNGLGGLGGTEGGAAGTKIWLTGQDPAQPQPFGILNSQAVLLASGPFVTWIPQANSSGNLDVRVNRHPGVWGSGLDTGLSFRVVDAGNYFFAYTSESSNPTAPRNLTVGFYQGGTRFNLITGMSMPGSWTTLRAVTNSDGSLKVYADATLVYATSNNSLAAATGAGLYNNSSGLGLVNRWDNFTIYDAP